MGEKVTIEIFAKGVCGRVGGLAYMDADIAASYVKKGRAKYVTITDAEPEEKKIRRSRKPSEDIKAE